jgi:hypothetical protein
MGCFSSKVTDSSALNAQFVKVVGLLKRGEAFCASVQIEPNTNTSPEEVVDRIMGYDDRIYSSSSSGPCENCGKDKLNHLDNLSYCNAAVNEVSDACFCAPPPVCTELSSGRSMRNFAAR